MLDAMHVDQASLSWPSNQWDGLGFDPIAAALHMQVVRQVALANSRVVWLRDDQRELMLTVTIDGPLTMLVAGPYSQADLEAIRGVVDAHAGGDG